MVNCNAPRGQFKERAEVLPKRLSHFFLFVYTFREFAKGEPKGSQRKQQKIFESLDQAILDQIFEVEHAPGGQVLPTTELGLRISRPNIFPA
jgi:hypothetical protein